MCGIAGLLEPRPGPSRGELEARARAMSRAVAHRGPDGEGVWADPAEGVALGHRRLAIVDLTPAGAQPMASASGRYVVTYNGEVYNFEALRAGLARQGATFVGRSDTEVLLAAVEAWGLAEALRQSAGMFALALWDRQERRLHLARDRVGKKPLAYGWTDGGILLFGSELGALRAHPGCPRDLDPAALAGVARVGCVPGTRTVLAGVAKVPPGSIFTFVPGRREPAAAARFWSAQDVFAAAARARGPAGGAAVDRVAAVLRQAVRERMVADVPLGALLSGGIDSSVVVALMAEEGRATGGPRVRTFTIGFDDPAFDEGRHARAVAEHLGTDHHELRVSPEQALAAAREMARRYDEPFADPSQIPTVLVSQLARQHVTVALTGDGGDEVFGGYVRHAFVEGAWSGLAPLPAGMRRGLGAALGRVPAATWDRWAARAAPVLPRRLRHRGLGLKMQRLAAALPAEDEAALHRAFRATGPGPDEALARAPSEEPSVPAPPGLSGAERMMHRDLTTYLPEDVLTKVDRASMSVGLEVRCPMLDHRVIEVAAALPTEWKVHRGEGKVVLRRILHRHVPRALVERPKAGFAVPVASWLRGPLRGWAEGLLDPPALARSGVWRVGEVHRRWAQHLRGERDWHGFLWAVLMVEAWLEERARTPAPDPAVPEVGAWP